jgi:hypothetical protein
LTFASVDYRQMVSTFIQVREPLPLPVVPVQQVGIQVTAADVVAVAGDAMGRGVVGVTILRAPPGINLQTGDDRVPFVVILSGGAGEGGGVVVLDPTRSAPEPRSLLLVGAGLLLALWVKRRARCYRPNMNPTITEN